MLQIVLLYSLYGIVFVLCKQALIFSKPIFLTGSRMVIGGIASYLLYRMWYKPVAWNTITWMQIWYLFLLAFFNVYLTNANEAWSLQYLSAGKVAFIYNLSPFFSLLFSRFMFQEQITWQKILGIVIASVAITPLLVEDTVQDVVDNSLRLGFFSMAEVIMIISAAATAYGWIIMKYLMDMRSDFNSYFLNGISLFVGGLLCFGQTLLLEPTPYVLPGYLGSFAWYTMVMMLFQNVIAYNFNSYLLTRYSPTLVILFSFIMPIITAIFGFFMLSEPLTIQFFVCSFGVAIGLLIFYQQELAEERAGA